MKKPILLLLFFISLSGCKQGNQMSITEFKQEGLDKYTLLDVRTPEEFADGHLENAVNINWYDEDFAAQVAKLSKDNTIYVYCQKGGRSAMASAVLDSLGFRAIDLTGGYGALNPDTDN